MPTSVREQVLAAITAAVGGKYGVPSPDDERDLPLTVLDDGQDVATHEYGRTDVATPVAIARLEKATSNDREVLRKQANEILAQIQVDIAADETFGELADEAEYTGGVISSELGKWVGAEAFFTVRYHHVRGDPYTIETEEED